MPNSFCHSGSRTAARNVCFLCFFAIPIAKWTQAGEAVLPSVSAALILLLFFASEVYNAIFSKGIIDTKD